MCLLSELDFPKGPWPGSLLVRRFASKVRVPFFHLDLTLAFQGSVGQVEGAKKDICAGARMRSSAQSGWHARGLPSTTRNAPTIHSQGAQAV